MRARRASAGDRALKETSMGLLEGKVAVVTGAARGQGAAAARRFHAEGAAVLLIDVNDAAGRSVASELGDRALYVSADVRSAEAWKAAISQAEDAFGPVSVLLNDAAIVRAGTTEDTTYDQFREMMDINVWGSWLGMQQVIPSMRRAGGGSIINVSSTGGLMGPGGASAYTASKFEKRGLTKVAALELAPDIRVNSLHPGWVDTPMVRDKSKVSDEEFARRIRPIVPMGRAAEASELAKAALFLASDLSSYLTGSELVADGGRTAGAPWTRPE
jgi:3alpha(or 20beta)-hydroxysteroid dehydrogenase